MLVIHDQVKRRRELGAVACACPACLEVTRWTMTEVVLVTRLYFIPTGPGELEEVLGSCSACGRTRRVEVPRFAGLVPDSLAIEATVEDLAAATNPGAWQHLEAAKARHQRLESGTTTADDRVELAVDALIDARAMMLRNQFRVVHWSVWALLLVSFGAFAVGVVVVATRQTSAAQWTGKGLLVASAAALPLFVVQTLRSRRMYQRRRLVGPMADALRPVGISTEEVSGAYRKLAAMHYPNHELVRERDLLRGLNKTNLSVPS